MPTRRDSVLALALACNTPLVIGQALKATPTKRLGVIFLGSESQVPAAQRQPYVSLRQKGWVLGENLIREPAFANGNLERLPGLAEGLVRSRVDAIYAAGPEGVLAAARATRSIPIVGFDMYWPTELGLVESETRPGRNVTGLAVPSGADLATKRLEFLKAIVPNASRAAWLVGAQLEFETLSGTRWSAAPTLAAAARSGGFEPEIRQVLDPKEFDRTLAELIAWRPDVMLGSAELVTTMGHHMAEVLLRHRMPSAFASRGIVEAGGLLSYWTSPGEAAYRLDRMADYIDRVLRGTPPTELPLERPKRYELVINLKTAKALGLTVPQSLLLRADEVIQ